MRRDSIKTLGIHNIHFIQRRLIDVCIEAVSHVEVLASRNHGKDTADKLAEFFTEMATVCKNAHQPEKKVAKNGK